MAKARVVAPLQRPAFDLLRNWLDTALSNPSQYARNDRNFIKQSPSVRTLLKKFSQSTWPTDSNEYFCYEAPGTLRSALTLNTTLRKWLALASEANLFHYVAVSSVVTGKENPTKPRFRLAWANPASGKHVIWCKPPYSSEYMDLIIRGARIEAEVLGHDFHCLRVDTKQTLSPQVDRFIADVDSSRTPDYSKYVAIVDLIDPAALTSDSLKCKTVTGGYSESDYRQDNLQIGMKLADALWNALKQSKKTVVILAPRVNGAVRGHTPAVGPVGKRIHSFNVRLKDLCAANPNVDCSTQTLHADFGSLTHAHELCTTIPAKLATMVKNGEVGVFAPSGHPATLLLSAIHTNDQLSKHVKVVAADITPTLLTMIRDSGYPLESLCGADPIEYGRIYVRTACGIIDCPAPIRPLLITRDTITLYGIDHTSDIVDYEEQL